MNDERTEQPPPVFVVDLQLGASGCANLPACRKYAVNIYTRLVGKYLGEAEPCADQIINAHIDLRDLSYEDYIAQVKKRYKGNVVRDARRSDKAGFTCRPFVRANHLPDLVEINHSKDERCGKPMRGEYLKTLESMGGPPKKLEPLTDPACPLHYDRWWGVFKPEPGHRQGELVTNERLIAYIDFRRIGELAIYSLILGHGDYLREGIMYRLHFAIMEWVLKRDSDLTRGIQQLMYAGFYQGGEGLQLWKKKTCFEPCHLVVKEGTGAALGLDAEADASIDDEDERAADDDPASAIPPVRGKGLWRTIRNMMGSG